MRNDYFYEVFAISVFLLLVFVIPQPTFDWWSYVTWAEYIRSHGLDQLYSLHFVNYMPFNVMAIHFWQVGVNILGLALQPAVHGIKIYPMFFDCLSVLLVLRICKKWNYSPVLALLCLLPNVAFHYNSLIWGQFDSVYTFFVLLSVYLISRNKPFWGFISYLFALNSKIQAIIFLPIVLLLFFNVMSQEKKNWTSWMIGKQVLFTSLVLLFTQWLLFLPFDHSAAEILQLVWTRSQALSSYVTFNADNLWILTGAKSMLTKDTQPWLWGLTYRTWGFLLFFTSSGFALVPLCVELVKKIRARVFPHNTRQYLLSVKELFEISVIVLYVISMNFFFFLTQMHERYSHPTIIFSALIAVIYRKPGILFLTSLAYVINLDRINGFWFITPLLTRFIQADFFAALLYLIALGGSLWLLPTEYWKNVHQKKGKPVE